MQFGNKQQHLECAKSFLATGETKDLIHVALELRFCLEIMTYEKLRSFAKHLPVSFVERTWQPPQLLDAMKQFDPLADASFELYMGKETTPGVPADPASMQFFGKHHAFGLSWLRKQYNSLGSYLHARKINAVTDIVKVRESLQAIAKEIEDAQSCDIIGALLANIINFTCQICKAQVRVSEHYARSEKKAVCQNQACQADYVAVQEEKRIGFKLNAVEAKCLHCGENILIQKRHFTAGQKVVCDGCNGEHVISCRWLLHAVNKSGAPAAEAP